VILFNRMNSDLCGFLKLKAFNTNGFETFLLKEYSNTKGILGGLDGYEGPDFIKLS